jgi:hypothetical protein
MPDMFDRNKLRAEAVALLGFDPDRISPLEALTADVAGSLLLIVDEIQTAQLNGRPADMTELAEAVKLLRSLLPASSVTPPPPSFEGARERLADLLRQRAEARDYTRERVEREEIASLKAALADSNAKLAALTAPAPLPRPKSAPATPQLDRPKPLTAHQAWAAQHYGPARDGPLPAPGSARSPREW